MDNGASSYRRFLNGDESAFDEIIKEYRNSLTFFINSFLHDIAASEDIAIDVFMELIVHKHRYNFKTSLKTYLFMLGRSRALDCIKHNKKLKMVDLSEADEEGADYISLEEEIIADERKKVVNDALCKLPDEMRTAMHLVYFENFSYEEAAKVMKKSRKQIDNLLYRGKSQLRTIIGKEGELLL